MSELFANGESEHKARVETRQILVLILDEESIHETLRESFVCPG